MSTIVLLLRRKGSPRRVGCSALLAQSSDIHGGGAGTIKDFSHYHQPRRDGVVEGETVIGDTHHEDHGQGGFG